jgi:hypothetical protein
MLKKNMFYKKLVLENSENPFAKIYQVTTGEFFAPI